MIYPCRLLRLPVIFLVSMPVFADQQREYTRDELFNLDLKTLLGLKITTASRTEETVARTANAVTVITREDIQRSGFLTLPEILRLAPGVNVGRVDSNKFWVSIRGFENRFNNKLQVMINGRKLYNQLFSGTYWEQQMPFLEDIERIEIVRGSGSTLWGSNAMNGVINIVTRNSLDTADGMVSVALGDEELGQRTALRQGWQSNHFSGRVYGQDYQHDDGQLTDNTQVRNAGLNPGDGADDEWRNQLAGFRMDWQFDIPGQSLMLEGESYDAHFDQTRLLNFGTIALADKLFVNGQHLLTTYKQPLQQNQTFSFVGYIDEYDRRDGSFEEQRQTINGTLQYDLNWTANQLTLGWEQQQSDDHTRQVSTIFLDPADKTLDSTGIFIQNRFNWLEDALIVTVGTRFDKNEYTQWENQPAIKANYEISSEHYVWSSWSKSVTTPGRFDSESFQQFGPSVIPIGSLEWKPERLTAWEIGYRFAQESFTADLSFYKNYYENISQFLTPGGDSVSTNGVEIAINKQWTDQLSTRLQYAYNNGDKSTYTFNTRSKNITEQLSGAQINWKLTETLQANFCIYYNTNPLPEINNNIYQSNNRFDINIQYQIYSKLRLTLAGQNLLEDAESQRADNSRLNSGVERAFYVKADWSW